MIAPNEQSGGKRKKHIRPTRAEHAKRIEFVRKMLGAGATTQDIKAAMRSTYDVRWKTIYRYLARAREQLLAATGKPRADHIAESFELYRQVQADPKEKGLVKLKARALIDKLLGLETPQRHEHSGPGESPIQLQQAAQVSEQLLHETDYLEYLRTRAIASDARSVCTNGQPGLLANGSPPRDDRPSGHGHDPGSNGSSVGD